MAPLSWRHHTLLQALLHRGPLSERDFHAVFAGVSGKDPGTPSALLPLSSSLGLFFSVRAVAQQVLDEMHAFIVLLIDAL
jgi:hypothetical protein